MLQNCSFGCAPRRVASALTRVGFGLISRPLRGVASFFALLVALPFLPVAAQRPHATSAPSSANHADAVVTRCSAMTMAILTRPSLDEKIPADSAALAAMVTRDSLANVQRTAEVRDSARACLSRLVLTHVSDTALVALANLQHEAGDEAAYAKTLTRLANAADVPFSTRYLALSMGVMMVTPVHGIDAVDLARRTIPIADSTGDAGARVDARVAYASAVRVRDSILAYGPARDALAFAQSLDTVSQQAAAGGVARLISYVGEWAVADHEPAIGVGFATVAASTFGRWPRFTQAIVPLYDRLALIGTHAQPIDAPYWINAPAGQTHMAFDDGKVTLIEFTAHWCHGCKFSYGALGRLYKQLAPQGLRVVFATRLYGYVGRQMRLAPPGEVAADSALFVGEYGATFPIAIAQAPHPTAQSASPEDYADVNSRHYHVDGLPQFILIDRHGVIHNVWTGWDEASFLRQVMPLLAEHS